MFRQKTKTMDMTEGPIISKLIIFALPIAITSSLQQLFNAADIIVCGRFVGSVALAAVGANSQIINLFINTFLGLSVGANVMIANYIGAENKQKTEDTVQTSMSFAICFGIILMIVGLLFSKIDWETLIEESPALNDSINAIKKLKKSKKFNISILTHVNSLKEAKSKIEFINSLFNDLTIIPVPKSCSKTMMTQTKNAILLN